MGRSIWWARGTAAACVALAACGGSSDGATTATTARPATTTQVSQAPATTTAPATSEPEAREDAIIPGASAADQARTDVVAISPADLPPGWTSAPGTAAADDPLVQCVEAVGPDGPAVAGTVSDELVTGAVDAPDGGALQVRTVLFPSPELAASALAAHSEARSCLDDGFRSLIERHFTQAAVTGEMSEAAAADPAEVHLVARYALAGTGTSPAKDFEVHIHARREGSMVSVVRAVGWGTQADGAAAEVIAARVAALLQG